MWALALNSGGGGKTRFSRSVESISRWATAEAGKEDMQDPLGKQLWLGRYSCPVPDIRCETWDTRADAGEASAETLAGERGGGQVSKDRDRR